MIRLFALAVIVAAFSLKSRPEIVTIPDRARANSAATVTDSELGVIPARWVSESPRQGTAEVRNSAAMPEPIPGRAAHTSANESRGYRRNLSRTRGQGPR